MKLTAKNWKKQHEEYVGNPDSSREFCKLLIKAVVKDLAGKEAKYYKSDDLPAWKSGYNQHRQEVLEKGERWVI